MKKNTTAQEAVRCAPAHACVRVLVLVLVVL